MRLNTSPDPATAVQWKKGTYCENANCVEVLALRHGPVLVRDSKLSDSPIIAFSRPAWTRFVAELHRTELPS
ncbi:MAG: DUF397 domain-containing protein [Micromonosporaceae bacterium]|nr:DUF397 domain-containing protein [Micromonosporaceae bacterium]